MFNFGKHIRELAVEFTCLPGYIKFQTFPPHCGDDAKVKTQHICLTIPQVCGAVVTND